MARKKNDRDFPAYLFHQGTNYKAQELVPYVKEMGYTPDRQSVV